MDGMKTFKLILLVVAVIALVAAMIQNQAPWQIHFLWMSGEISGIILLLLTAAAGFIMGITVSLLTKRGKKTTIERKTK